MKALLSTQPYNTLSVVSPLQQGGEKKDQDRARWFPEDLVGCVCDGVSSSPFAAEAAEFVSRSAPILFRGKLEDRLGMLAEILTAWRKEARGLTISVPPDLSAGVAEMLREAGRRKLQDSHQTTLVAVALEPGEARVQARFIRCGDSAYFVFSRPGELLTSSFESGPETPRRKRAEGARDICFKPGTELLGRIIGSAARHPRARRLLRRRGANPEKWVLCSVLDRSGRPGCEENEVREMTQPLIVRTGERLLIPRYLVTPIGQAGFRNLGYFPFSRVIQPLDGPPAARGIPQLSAKGHATAVVPDHVETGDLTHLREQFPLDSHFVLASDGFYSVFSTPRELWMWLTENERVLEQESGREELLQALHERRQDQEGDDDISFVWMRPNLSAH